MAVGMKVIGMAPGSAVSHVLSLYDKLPEKDKVKLLLNERSLAPTIKGPIAKEFSSRKTMDINAGELLALGVTGAYYNETGKAKRRTFQVVVGVDDASKANKENVLSDGAIWENEIRQKMPFQQTLVQGYFPPAEVNTDAVKKAIDEKVKRRKRGDYPDNCGLIVNLFSEGVAVDLNKIVDECEIEVFSTVFLIIYELPDLTKSIIYFLEKSLTPAQIEGSKIGFDLARFENETAWQMND